MKINRYNERSLTTAVNRSYKDASKHNSKVAKSMRSAYCNAMSDKRLSKSDRAGFGLCAYAALLYESI